MERFVAEKGVFWPEICDGKGDAGGVTKLYNVHGTPDLFVIDRAGNIAARLKSAKLLDQQLTEVTATEAFPPRTRRDTWQRPVKVMDDLGIRSGSVVADVGAASGYFTFRLAARVGPKGKVYAQDLDEDALARIRERAQKEKIDQIETIRGAEDDPKLPEASLDAVLIVDALHEFTRPDAMMAGLFRALKAGGRFGVIDNRAPLGLSRTDYLKRHSLPQENVVEHAARAGWRLVSFEADFASAPGGTHEYFLVFEKPR